jgi:hypothetical protein
MLTSYLLTKFHDFSVYLISGTWSTIGDFSRNQKGEFINVCVTNGAHGPGRPCKTKPEPGGHKRWPVGPTMASQPHFGAKSVGPWRVRLLEGGKGITDFTRSV